jgi:hypothetical protein
MKKVLFAFLILTLAISANAQITPSEKVSSARSKSSLGSLTEEQIAELNFRADHLVTVEASKNSSAADFNLTLIENGKMVKLSDAEMLSFNPLLYAIPQDEVVCNNLHVQSKEGNTYTIVVLSKQQFDQQFKQYLRDIKKKK